MRTISLVTVVICLALPAYAKTVTCADGTTARRAAAPARITARGSVVADPTEEHRVGHLSRSPRSRAE